MAIMTSYETLDPTTGYRRYHSQVSYRKVIAQIGACLEEIKLDHVSANRVYEWLAPNVTNKDDDFPVGEAFAVARYGNNEGFIVEVFVENRPMSGNSVIASALKIKFLTDGDFVQKVAWGLTKAFNEGLYESLSPPQMVA